MDMMDSIRAVESNVLLSLIQEQDLSHNYITTVRPTIPIKGKDGSFTQRVCTFFKYAFALACIVSVGFAAFISMEMQAGLEAQFLSETGMNMTHSAYMDFLAFFSIPNIPGSFLGGYVVNWMGHRNAAVFFVALSFTGQFLGFLGSMYFVTWVMFLGRMIFGLAVEIANITVFAYVVQWFKGGMYNFAFAMSVAIARLGTVVTMYGCPVLADALKEKYNNVSQSTENNGYSGDEFLPWADISVTENNTNSGEIWTDHKSIVLCYGLTTALILLSLTGVTCLLFLEPDEEEVADSKPIESADESTQSILSQAILSQRTTDSAPRELLTCCDKLCSVFWVALDLVKYLWKCVEQTIIRLKFTAACWLVIIVCMVFYSAMEPWVFSAKRSFEKYHGVPDTILEGEWVNRSALLTTLISAVPIVACPLMGLIIDQVKGNACWTFLGGFLSMVGHILLMYPTIAGKTETPFALLVFTNLVLGLGYSMVASSIWTLLSYTVTPEDSNIAYGVIQSMQHIGFIISSKINGEIIAACGDNFRAGYFGLELFFTLCMVLSSLVILIFLGAYGTGSGNLFTASYRRL